MGDVDAQAPEQETVPEQQLNVEDVQLPEIEIQIPDITPTENNDGIYIVEKGDTLAIISRKMYGDLDHVDAICRMNGIENGNLILVGQKLLLP